MSALIGFWRGALLAGAVFGTTSDAAVAHEDGCAAQASRSWDVGADRALTVEVFTAGPSCANATATLVIRDPDGVPIWADAFIVPFNFMLRDATSAAEMTAALERWIDPAESTMHSTAALPAWAPDANNPGEEFPFVPSQTYGYREDYESLRAEDRPLLCLVSGGESMLCLVYGDGWIDEVGHQSFPG
jgi:hypothetical protein